ncbi:hypothetical protein KIPB_008993, partial [Kipferlia bialata]
IHVIRTIFAVAILLCCAANSVLLGWEHMIAAGAWDWGWLIMLGVEGGLVLVNICYHFAFCNTIESEEYNRPHWFFGILMVSSALFALDSALRFYMMYVSLSMEHEYWQAPKTTHMYYGLYMIAALGSACLSVVWLGMAVMGGIVQLYPIYDIERIIDRKREGFFQLHGAPVQEENDPGEPNAVVDGNVPDVDNNRLEQRVQALCKQREGDKHNSPLPMDVSPSSMPRVVNTCEPSESEDEVEDGVDMDGGKQNGAEGILPISMLNGLDDVTPAASPVPSRRGLDKD